MLVRCPSSSKVKREAIEKSFRSIFPGRRCDLQSLPVELQSRADLRVNAQPEGEALTTSYADNRWYEMCKKHGPTTGFDVIVESGAIDGKDVVVVVICTSNRRIVTLSRGVPFPPGTLEEARRRGFKTVTAGDIIHEQMPEVPNNHWHRFFPPGITREEQIREAIIQNLRLHAISR
jgi:non-canonical (house-cleaning) NTP pyrophosphatase